MVCEKCRGQHPTNKCRKIDKVITLQPPPGDYPQQAQANLQGAQLSDSNDVAGPSNLYYDHQNNKQTHTSPSGLQTKQRIIPLINSQDVRYMDAVLLNNTLEKKEDIAQVVLKSSRLTGEDTGIKLLDRPVTEKTDEETEESSGDKLDFLELNDAMKTASKEAQLDKEPPEVLESDKDEYQFVNQPVNPIAKVKPSKATNPAGPYDLWMDLAQAKANISFGQLIQLAPSLQKKMREGATTRRERKVGQLNHLQEIKKADFHWSPNHTLEYEYESVEIEIEVEIVDKWIPQTVIDDGANINIMPESTMKKLGLAITHPSKYSIRIADQALITPMGRIRDLKMRTGAMDYQLNFEVLPMRGSLSTVLNDEAYPLLLDRGFLRQCGGVVDWSTRKPTFTYGPPDNRTKVLIGSKVGKNGVKLRTETASPNKLLNIATSSRPTPTSNLDSRIKCLGPGLYDFVDEDGTFADWLRENPYSDDEIRDPVTKDPFFQEIEKISSQTHPFIHKITKPSAMFMEQVTIGNTTKQVAMVDENLGRKILQPKNGHISFKTLQI